MQWNNSIVFGTDREHTKVYDKERHCYNCELYDGLRCITPWKVEGQFQFKDDYPPDRQLVYIGRVLAGVCRNYKLKGKDWDK
jgi:hypothetical protein